RERSAAVHGRRVRDAGPPREGGGVVAEVRRDGGRPGAGAVPVVVVLRLVRPDRTVRRTRRRRSMKRSYLYAIVVGLATGLAVAGFERVVVDVLFDRVLRAPLAVQAVSVPIGLLVAAGA